MDSNTQTLPSVRSLWKDLDTHSERAWVRLHSPFHLYDTQNPTRLAPLSHLYGSTQALAQLPPCSFLQRHASTTTISTSHPPSQRHKNSSTKSCFPPPVRRHTSSSTTSASLTPLQQHTSSSQILPSSHFYIKHPLNIPNNSFGPKPNRKVFKCICGKKLKTRQAYNSHTSFHKPGSWPCPKDVCHNIFKTSERWKEHLKFVHGCDDEKIDRLLAKSVYKNAVSSSPLPF